MFDLVRSAGEKKIIWIRKSNSYILLEQSAFNIIKRIKEGEDLAGITQWCAANYELPISEAERYVREVSAQISAVTKVKKQAFEFEDSTATNPPDGLEFVKTVLYLYNGINCSVEYQTEELVQLIHPKFAHLDTTNNSLPANYYFKLYIHQGKYVLMVDGSIIGNWSMEETHFFTGKFSMELLNRMVSRTESDWMAVLHASAVSRGGKCMLFLGDSGSGKSTLLALLMANGFNLLADDFVPVEAKTALVFNFPAAVSVKAGAFTKLVPFYPELATAQEHNFSENKRNIKFIHPSPSNSDACSGFPCEAIVFVKYKKYSRLKITKTPPDIAFQKLIPDSWISPLPENAAGFLDWFLSMPCYQLNYSNTGKMIYKINELFLLTK